MSVVALRRMGVGMGTKGTKERKKGNKRGASYKYNDNVRSAEGFASPEPRKLF